MHRLLLEDLFRLIPVGPRADAPSESRPIRAHAQAWERIKSGAKSRIDWDARLCALNPSLTLSRSPMMRMGVCSTVTLARAILNRLGYSVM
jgi:hypothetical protein